MHLYNLLHMLLGDFQYDVEEFIRQEDPSVLETPAPSRPKRTRKPKTGQETIFTRLRNELGHPRPGTNLVKTKGTNG